jgi:hypothetical protein
MNKFKTWINKPKIKYKIYGKMKRKIHLHTQIQI